MIKRINQFRASDGNEVEMFEFLRSLIPYISSSPGCRSCEVMVEIEDTSRCAVIEEWESVEHHKAAAANFPKEEMAKAMVLFARPPTGVYYRN